MARTKCITLASFLVSLIAATGCATVWSHGNPDMLGSRFDYELADCQRYALEMTNYAQVSEPLLRAASVQSFTEDCMERKGYRAK